jgi:glycosyltransferase involved in cell wall biosynthesis
MKLVAILATYNEEHFVANCVRNLVAQGALIYLIDNESTDATIRRVRETAGNALVGVESFPRHGIYSWQPILERKEQIANQIEADWFMHVDADEIHLPPSRLADACSCLSGSGGGRPQRGELRGVHIHPRRAIAEPRS